MAKELPVKVKIEAVDKISKALDKVKAKFPELARATTRTNRAFDILNKSTAKLRGNLSKVGSAISGVGKAASIGITAPVLAAAAFSVKKFADIEEALIDVKGATNLSSDELKEFGNRVANISKKVPVTQESLLEFAAAAGEAGVRGVDNLEKFSLGFAKLARTAGLKGTEAVDSIAKILNLTGEGPAKIENFGSAVTALGDTYGVNAKRVIDASFEISREISKFGVSSSQIAGLASAMEPLGFSSKQMSTAVGEAFRGIDDAIRSGGVKMKGLEAITGMTGAQLKKTFAEDSTKVFEKFITGMQKIEKNGGPTGKALAFFGASGDKTQIILGALAKDTNKLNEMLKFSGEQYKANTALSNEYAESTETFASKMTLFNNNLTVLGQKIGEMLIPFLNKFLALMIEGMTFLENNPGLTKTLAVLAGIAAIVGPILVGFGVFVGTILPALITGFNFVVAALAGLAPWLTAIGTLLAGVTLPVWATIAAVAALVAGIYIFRDSIMKGAGVALDWITDKLTRFSAMVTGVIGSLKTMFGFGGQTLNVGANGPQSANGPSLVPQGTPLGGAAVQSQMNPEFSTQTNNARVDINVRAPESTRVVGESQGGFMSINRGLAGAF